MDFDFLTKNSTYLFKNSKNEQDVLEAVNDLGYRKFMNHLNGGYFFNKSLLIYGFGDVQMYSSFVEMNLLVNSSYKDIAHYAQYFGCDVFGNQFAFCESNICFFNIETGQFEVLCKTFAEWVELIREDLNYYTGQSLVIGWEKLNPTLALGDRLCAKKPFVIGGDYTIENLYPLNMESLIRYNADIARQIHSLPDGTKIVLKVAE